jgi:DtxR family Mn-dependent transcriptional regulator
MTTSEENYLKAIYALCDDGGSANTNAIAERLNTKASSVTDMIQKLSFLNFVTYEKYKGATLTGKGREIALAVIRKHRLWEVFLVEKLGFKWDEVHDIAEQLEHVQSKDLITRLDNYLGYPRFDPHGDPIPDERGNIQKSVTVAISDMKEGDVGVIAGVSDTSTHFLKYLAEKNLSIGTEIKILKRYSFDHSVDIYVNDGLMTVSSTTAGQIHTALIKQ